MIGAHNREDYQNCSVQYCVLSQQALTNEQFLCVFACFFLPRASLFCAFFVFVLVYVLICFELSVPVQVTGWKDLSQE